MKRLILTLVALSFVTAVTAQPLPTNQENLDTFKESYNSQSSKVPSFVGNIVGGETVNFNFKSNTSTQTIGVKFDGVEIRI